MREGVHGRQRGHGARTCCGDRIGRGHGLASFIHIGLGEIDLFGEEFELGGDLVIVGELRLGPLVGCLPIRVQAADDRLEQVL